MQNEKTSGGMSYIQHEPVMSYQPLQQDPVEQAAATSPVPEPNPRMVTPLTKLGSVPADVDCPYCRKVFKTEVRQIDAENASMMQCLICLVCWPALFCYETDKHINHHCSGCKRQLTHKPHGSAQVQVVATTQAQPATVPSQFEQS